MRQQQASLQTDLCRKGLWQSGRVPLPEGALDFLGQVKVAGTLRTSPDLPLLAWLTERWRQDRDASGFVDFTLYEVGAAIYGRKPGGAENARLRAALRRLWAVTVDVDGWTPSGGYGDRNRLGTWTRLVELVEWSDGLNEPATAGQLRGDTFRAKLGPWVIERVRAGHITYLDWETLRALYGLAQRLWVYLAAERFDPAPKNPDEEKTWIKLGDRAYAALGMNYAQDRQARAAINRAGAAICAVDKRYQSVAVERRPGGWAIIATRIRSRERAAIRAAVRASFDG